MACKEKTIWNRHSVYGGYFISRLHGINSVSGYLLAFSLVSSMEGLNGILVTSKWTSFEVCIYIIPAVPTNNQFQLFGRYLF